MVTVKQSPPPTAPTAYSGQAPPPPPAYSGQAPPPPPTYYGQAPPHIHGHPPPPSIGVPVQPSPLQAQGSAPGPWSSGLCDCFSDVPNCCITCWCPCITFGQVAEIVDKGSTSCGASGALYALIMLILGCPCIYSCCYRTRIRTNYNLRGDSCGDCLAHCCCECCALCQEYRELQNRGFDMTIGWHANVERQNQGVTMAPFSQGGMTR